MLIHPSPSRNNIKRSGRTQLSSPSRSPKLFSGQCMHECACTNAHMYIHMWCKVHNPPHFAPRESAPEREGESNPPYGGWVVRSDNTSHTSVVYSVRAFSLRISTDRRMNGWCCCHCSVFSRYLDAHFSTILAVGLLRQLNAEQYFYYFALYFASFVVIVLRLTPISLPLSLSLSRAFFLNKHILARTL